MTLDAQLVAGADERAGPARDAIASRQTDVSPGHGDKQRPLGDEGERQSGDLDRGLAGIVTDKGVGECVRDPIRGSCRGHAATKMSRASGVLQRGVQTGRDDADHQRTNRTRSPSRNSAGGSRLASNRIASVDPIRRQPPGEANG